MAVLLWAPTCALACWWQITVALSGDSLGWLYSIEWPAFGLFGIIVWWNLIHDDPARRRVVRPPDVAANESAPGNAPTTATARLVAEEDEALAAYNDYLEALAGTDRPKTWRRR